MENLHEKVLEVINNLMGDGEVNGKAPVLLAVSVAPYDANSESHKHWCAYHWVDEDEVDEEDKDKVVDGSIYIDPFVHQPQYTVRVLDTLEGLTLADGEMFYISEIDGEIHVHCMEEDSDEEFLYHDQPSYYGGHIDEGIEWVRSLSNSTIIK